MINTFMDKKKIVSQIKNLHKKREKLVKERNRYEIAVRQIDRDLDELYGKLV